MNYDIVLVDGMNKAYAFYWTHRHLHDKRGRGTGILYGMYQFVDSLIKKHKKAKIYVAWDSPNLIKKGMVPQYKANRKKKEDIHPQVDIAKEGLKFLKVNQIFANGYEADDIVSKIVLKNKDKKILFITKDHDWALVMNKKIRMEFGHKEHTLEDLMSELELNNKYEYRLFLSITSTHNNVKGIPYINKAKVKGIISGIRSIDKLFKLKVKKIFVKVYNKIKDNEKLVRDNYEFIYPITKGYKIIKMKNNKNVKDKVKFLESYSCSGLIKTFEDEDLELF